MTSRYVFCPMTAKKIGRRVSLMTRIKRFFSRPEAPDVFPVTGYYNPVYPGNKNPLRDRRG